mmetsp:Transcript_3481/g.5428  ORF Transcript_3481/g.5428 Transcript_3481/m.5428 type:complete len:580 (-) Transcript_3481:1325-3064(-)
MSEGSGSAELIGEIPQQDAVDIESLVILPNLPAGEHANEEMTVGPHSDISDSVSLRHFRSGSDPGEDGGEHSRQETYVVNMTDVSISIRDRQSYEFSSLQILGGAAEHILVMQIFIYLTSEDLCKVAATARVFNRLAESPVLWTLLYKKDFIVTGATADNSEVIERDSISLMSLPLSLNNTVNNTAATHTTAIGEGVGGSAGGQLLYNKAAYIRRYNEFSQRIVQAKEDTRQVKLDAVRAGRISCIEDALDFTQIRLMAPLFLAGVFVSSVLFCQKLDGEIKISFWLCFTPLFISMGYVIISLVTLTTISNNQFSSNSLLRGVWANAKGPLVSFHREVINGKKWIFRGVCGALGLVVIQIMLVAAKLQPSTPDSIQNNLSWGLVFVPLWLFFLATMVLPLLTDFVDTAMHLFIVVVFLIPLMIFFICLAVKLNAQEKEDRPGEENMRFALILMPFWVIEGIAMVGSLFFLSAGINGYLRGVERSREYIAVFVVVWSLLLPIVIFQALLSARDDYQLGRYGHNQDNMKPTVTETASPLLVMLGCLWLFATLLSCTVKSSFQVARERVQHDPSSLRVLYYI